MKVSGSYRFDHDQEIVWNLLMDPQAIAQALPGVEALEPIEGEADAWRAEAKISFATVNGVYAGVVRMSERQPPAQYRLSVRGEGQSSVIDGTALISLSYDEAAGETLVAWDADANISGRLAGIGQRLIKAAANMMSRQFFQALAKQLPAR